MKKNVRDRIPDGIKAYERKRYKGIMGNEGKKADEPN